MFFTKTAKIFAWFILIPSILGHVLAVSIAFDWIGPYEWAINRYLGGRDTGIVIDKTTYYIGAALVLGVLAEISTHLRQAKAAD